MGIPGLWSLLTPAQRSTSLSELQGTRLAVDLSIWIYANTFVFGTDSRANAAHRMNMFYKVRRLVECGIRPVIVLEGSRPELKGEAIRRRQLQRQKSSGDDCEGSRSPPQWTGSPGSPGSSSDGTGRGYGHLLQEWKSLLEVLGIPVVRGDGDAEATCAQLESAGMVDGCVTTDGDTFLFGAETVYSKLSCSKTKGEEVEFYKMSDIESKLGWTRKHLVAMALLIGCDYGLEGVKNVASKKAEKLLMDLKDSEVDILDRLRHWRDNQELEELSRFKGMAKPPHCSHCGHEGNCGKHKKEGCTICGTTGYCKKGMSCDCPYHQKEQEYDKHASEIKIRAKALQDPNFPSEEIIAKFLTPKFILPEEPEWRRPDFSSLKNYLVCNMKLTEEKAIELSLKYLTSYDLQMTFSRGTSTRSQCASQPSHIIKTKKESGVDLLQIQWLKVDGVIDVDPMVTYEDHALFEDIFPNLVEEFESNRDAVRAAAVKKGKGKKRSAPVPDGKQRTLTSMRPVRRRLDFDSFSVAGGGGDAASNGVIPKSKTEVDESRKSAVVNLNFDTPKRRTRSSPEKPDRGASTSTAAASFMKSKAHVFPCSVSDCQDCPDTRTSDSPLPSASSSSPTLRPSRDSSITPKKDASTSPKCTPPVTPRKPIRGTPRRATPAKERSGKTMKSYYTSLKKKKLVTVGKASTCTAEDDDAEDVEISPARSTDPDLISSGCAPLLPSPESPVAVSNAASSVSTAVKSTPKSSKHIDSLRKTKSTPRRQIKESKNQRKLDFFLAKNMRYGFCFG